MTEAAARRPVALITAAAARGQDTDLAVLAGALEKCGVDTEVIDWDDPEIDWSRFALAVLRSAWDYSARLGEFTEWLDRVAAATRLVNPVEVIRWSLDKHYLTKLQRAGVPTVPTYFAEPGADAAAVVGKFLRRHDCSELVLKPAVGSGARDAQRFARSADRAVSNRLAELLAEGRSALLQPYLALVDAQGESALIYLEGKFSHAIVKSAVLHRGQAPTRELFAPETIAVRAPDSDELALGAQLLKALPFPAPLYARVDLLRDENGVPCVLELELAEPSLYLDYSQHAAAQLAASLAELARS